MKILHIINTLAVGGAETLLANSLATGGLQDYTENFLIYFQGDSDLLDKIDKRVKIINLEYKGWHTIGTLLKKIRKHIHAIGPDIIHTHLNPAGWYTALVKPKSIPQIHTMHLSYSDDTDTDKQRIFFERIFLLQKKNINLITLSPLLKEDLISSVKIKGKVFVLSNFIDDMFFEDRHPPVAREKEFKMIAVGNMRNQKNYAYLLDMFRYLKGLPVTVDVYGFGNHTGFSQIAAKESLAVNFKGPAKNPKDLYWRYNGFIMPSKFEGFGLTAYEAMASGIPLFLSDIPAFKSLIKNNALYFTLHNSAQAAKIIEEAINGKSDLGTMATEAKKYAENTVKRTSYTKHLIEIYNSILSSPEKSK
jgi:glycosyltransferase involved in cell wall biosynthesis